MILFLIFMFIIIRVMTHHQERGKQHRALLKMLAAAKVAQDQARQQWKATNSDADRFALQSAMTQVNQLEKKLWKFQ